MRAILAFAFFCSVCAAHAALFGVYVDFQVWVSTPKVPNQFDFSNKAATQFDNYQAQNNATADAVTSHGTRVGGIHDEIFDTGEANPGPIYDSRADANSADGQEFDLVNFTGTIGAPVNLPVTLSYQYTWSIQLATNISEAAYGAFTLTLAGTVIDTKSYQIGTDDLLDHSGGGNGTVTVTAVSNDITRTFSNAITSGWATAPPTPASTPEPSSFLALAVPIAIISRRSKLR